MYITPLSHDEYHSLLLPQAYMHLSIGISLVENSDYEGAIRSFELARAQMRHHRSRPLFVVSLVCLLGAILERNDIAHRL